MAKRIVISGVTRGLGRSLVQPFVTVKHTVAGCGRSAHLIEELRQKYPPPHSFDPVDVCDHAAVARWAAEVMQALGGPPDLLIANAAVMLHPAPLWTIQAEQFREIVDTNIRGVFHLIRAFVPAMVARKHGVIVALSSGWGRSTSPEVAPYCATKYAVEGLMLSLAQELPAGMAAIPLNPGVIDTEMLRRCWGDKAHTFPKADAWAKRAAPFLLNLGPKDNGKSLSVP